MKRIADYQLVRELGSGNHGQFFLAEPPERLGLDAEYVVVKVLARNAGDQAFRRVANELKLFASLDSPYLVRLHDAGHQGGVLFYATEYCPHGSLGTPARPLERHEVLTAVARAARAAHALHEVGVAHRDVKPTNVLLSDEGAKLSDLGLAQILSPGQTTTGFGPIGAIEYMDPAVMRGEKATRASDLWSLAVTLHRVLTGESLYGEIPSHDLVAALRHVLNSEPRLSESLDDGERRVIASCLRSEPSARPPTAEALAEEIEALVEKAGTS